MSSLSKSQSKQRAQWALLGDEVEKQSIKSRRAPATLVATICAALAMGAAYIHERSARNESEQGQIAGGQAIGAARAAMGMWSPRTGWSALRGRSLNYATQWRSSASVSPVPEASGEKALVVELAFSSKDQCRAATIAALSYFDLAFVDSKPATRDSQPCADLAQNAIRLVKRVPAHLASENAGALDPMAPQIAQIAQPATEAQIAEAERRKKADLARGPRKP